MSITIEYDEETGEFFASAFTSTYFPTAQPNGEGVHGMSESGSMMYTDSRTDIFLGYDYAGNCSAYTITGSQLDDNISLSAETDSIDIWRGSDHPEYRCRRLCHAPELGGLRSRDRRDRLQ